MQSGFVPLDGGLPPSRHRRRDPRRRPAAGPPARRRLPHFGDRARSCRASRCRRRPGAAAASRATTTWWPTPEATHRINQTVSSNPCCSRTRRRSRASASSTAPNSRNSRQDERRRDRRRPRSRQRRAHLDLLPISRRLRRRALGRPPRHGRGAVRHSGRPARAVDLFPRADAQEPAARRAGWMYLAFNPRRCGTMMSIDGKETWLIHNFLYNGEPEYDSVDRDWAIRIDPRRRRRSSNTRSSPRRIGSAAGWSPTVSRTAACSSAAMPRICGFRTPATA